MKEFFIFAVCYLFIVFVLATAYKYFDFEIVENEKHAPFAILAFPITIPMLVVAHLLDFIFVSAEKLAERLKGQS